MGFLGWLKSLRPAPAAEVSFSIEWPAEPFMKPAEFSNVRILITDIEGLTPDNAHQAFASSEVPAGQALVISPGLGRRTQQIFFPQSLLTRLAASLTTMFWRTPARSFIASA
jgi:hypothetical protein